MKYSVQKRFVAMQRPLLAALCLMGMGSVYANPGEGLAATGSTTAASQVAGDSAKQAVAANSTAPDTQTNAPATAESAAAAPASATDAATTAADAQATGSEPPPLDTSYDPSENFNRAMFTFNDKVDTYFMKPVATVYNSIMPKPLNQGIHNVFNNLGEITTIANDILQVNIYQMANDAWRFGVNTTIGIGGLFDVATRIGLPYYQNDFGLTLATYGYDQSSYLVLPFWGPRTWRDSMAMPVDFFALSIYPYIRPDSVRYQVYALSVVDTRANLIQYENIMEEAAIDKYAFMRDAYMQSRAAKIRENQHLGYDERDGQTAN